MKPFPLNSFHCVKGGSFLGKAFLFLLLLSAASCASNKKLENPMSHAADYQWMNARMSGELETSGGAYSFSGSLRMRRDSTVWISVSAFMGVESLRVLVTQDSVLVVNRIDQTYMAEPMAAFQTPDPSHTLTLQGLQSELLGNGTSEQVSIQWGGLVAKIRYSDIQWDEPQTFPIKINKKYERVRPWAQR